MRVGWLVGFEIKDGRISVRLYTFWKKVWEGNYFPWKRFSPRSTWVLVKM